MSRIKPNSSVKSISFNRKSQMRISYGRKNKTSPKRLQGARLQRKKGGTTSGSTPGGKEFYPGKRPTYLCPKTRTISTTQPAQPSCARQFVTHYPQLPTRRRPVQRDH